MNKEEFLLRLKDKIDIFTEEEQNKILSSYENGEIRNLEEIQKEIFLSHGINPDKVIKKGFYKKLEELCFVIRRVIDVMSKNEMKENAKIVLDFLVLLFLICLIKLPFLFIENILESLILPFGIPYVITILSVALELVYIVIALVVFINIFTKWFKNLKIKDRVSKKSENNFKSVDVKLKGESLEAISLEDSEK